MIVYIKFTRKYLHINGMCRKLSIFKKIDEYNNKQQETMYEPFVYLFIGIFHWYSLKRVVPLLI